MKMEKFREMTKDDLERKLRELQDNLFKLRVKIMTKQVENTAQLASTRRDIARVLTQLGEMQRKGIQTPAAAEKPAAAAAAPAKAAAGKPKTAKSESKQ